MGDIFLSPSEQRKVQEIYSVFVDKVKAESLIPHLFSNHVLNHQDFQTLDAEVVPFKKNRK